MRGAVPAAMALKFGSFGGSTRGRNRTSADVRVYCSVATALTETPTGADSLQDIEQSVHGSLEKRKELQSRAFSREKTVSCSGKPSCGAQGEFMEKGEAQHICTLAAVIPCCSQGIRRLRLARQESRLCLEKLPISSSASNLHVDREQDVITCYEKAGDIALLYLQEIEKTQTCIL
ncbi:hypothetical protein CB1_000726129 [Camelus ferus]|nr:hypothetical protein CB1_000726129 [Camelus ferus]